MLVTWVGNRPKKTINSIVTQYNSKTINEMCANDGGPLIGVRMNRIKLGVLSCVCLLSI